MRVASRSEMVAINQIVPYARNSRVHPPKQIAQLRASFREFGAIAPLVVDEQYNLLVGHGRLEAARAEGIPALNCVIVEHLTDAQKKAYIIADNKLSLNAEWDEEMLGVEFADLKAAGFDVELIGFSEQELQALFNNSLDTDVQDDDFDEDGALKDPPFVMSGDLWRLGKHRLLCGDSTNPDDVARLMNGCKANLVLTDPPYGISYDGKAGKIKNDDLDDTALFDFLLASFKNMDAAMASDASIYVFHADTKGEIFRRAFREADFHLSGCCIWKKNTFTLGRSLYQWQHEPVLVGWKNKGKHVWFASRSESTIWEYDKPKKNDIHSTMKPLPLLAYPIQNSTTSGGIVLDLFSGSFSTGMACEQSERICFAMEIDEKYASASIKRFTESYPNAEITCERGSETLALHDVVKHVVEKEPAKAVESHV